MFPHLSFEYFKKDLPWRNIMFIKNFIKTSAVTLAASMFVSSASADITKLVSFGDSLSDAGNVHAATGLYSAPYAGVNSNGPVWTQQLATALGVAPHTGSLTGGDGYAWGGARVTYGTESGASVPSLQQQVDTYLAGTGGVAEADTLYTVWGGANDALTAAATGDFSLVPTAAEGIGAIAAQLAAAGAESVLVINLPNIGYTPRQNGDPVAAAQGDFISVQYNNALSAYVGGAQAATGANIVLHDAYTWTGNLVGQSASLGLNAVDMCLDVAAGTMCSDPENHLWWDEIHPTTAGFSYLTADILNTVNGLDVAVPVPAAAWLFISGVAGLAGLRRAKK
jgi:phospholipase/lecithinase/hemolysin